MAKKKPAHGGKRSGAGRRPVHKEGKTRVIAASVPGSLVDQLDRWAMKRLINRSEAITEAVRRLIK